MPTGFAGRKRTVRIKKLCIMLAVATNKSAGITAIIAQTLIDTEISNYESKLKEVELNKARLEREIDSLPIDTTHRERKLHDMTLRLDALYDTIAEIEEKVEDAKLRRKSVEAEFITMENIYKILQHFGELYDIISDEEKKELIATLVKEIQIYPEGESDTPLKSMKFNFPVYKDGQEVNEIFLDKQTNVETLVKHWWSSGLGGCNIAAAYKITIFIFS